MKLHSLEYPLNCLKCGHEFKAKIGGSQDVLEIPCPACGVVTRYDTKEVRATLKEANRALDAFGKDMNKLFKK
jgi:hypothetical protein